MTNDELLQLSPISKEGDNDFAVGELGIPSLTSEVVQYRLYKRRFAGVVGIVLLNIVAGMNWPWFGPISNNMASEFGISLDQVNWLGNIVALTYLPVAPSVPILRRRFGLHVCYYIGAASLIIASWVRFAGTARSLPTNGAYALFIIGQLFSAISQALFQVLGPKYSETWFDLKGRTTATMIMAIANPVGGALGQLISPLAGSTRTSILVLGIISTAATPAVFLIRSAPPTPPTYAGSVPSPSLLATLRAIIGKGPLDSESSTDSSYMHPRERLDFSIMTMIFATLVGCTNSFSIQSAQILHPQGYSAATSGLMGAALLLSGIVAAIVTAPLFDRVLTHHLGASAKVACPIIALAWLSLVWAVRPNNTGPLFAVFVIIGVFSVTMLPIGLELGCELTRSADASSAILWFSANLLGITFVLAESALRAGPDANPPLNMRRALIFQGTFAIAVCSSVVMLRGKQVRRERDEQKRAETRPSGGIAQNEALT